MSRGRPSKRQVILEAATQLFIAQGYQGTSIDMVVKAAGVSKPTVYNNFSTKTALLSDIIPDVAESLRAVQAASLASHSGLKAVMAAYEGSCKTPAFIMLNRIRIGESHKFDEETQTQLAALDEQLSSWALQVLLDDGVEEGAASALVEQLKARYILATLCNQVVPDASVLADELAAFLPSGQN